MVQAEFAIIGGGISGLSTALALQRKGFRAEVYEQASGMNAPDTGIVLCGNAVRAFYILGLGPKLLEYGLASDICQLKSHSGELIAEFNYDAPTHIPNYLFIQRSVLHTLLADALLPGSLHFNKLLIDLKQDQHKIHVSFQDGSQAVSDFLIGCDGADSRIRSQYMPDGKLHYTGYVCWRGIVEAPSIEPIMYSETWGPRGRFGIAPMPGNRLYWYVFKKAEHTREDLAKWTPIDLLFNFFYYHEPIQELLESTAPENILFDKLYEVKNVEHIHTDQIILLGDAANASIPNIGQGASQAVEDAVYLAKWVSTVSPVEDAILKYEQHRQERIKRIKDDMKLYGLAARIDFPLLCSLRNKMMQLTPASYHSGKLRKIIEIEEEL